MLIAEPNIRSLTQPFSQLYPTLALSLRLSETVLPDYTLGFRPDLIVFPALGESIITSESRLESGAEARPATTQEEVDTVAKKASLLLAGMI